VTSRTNSRSSYKELRETRVWLLIIQQAGFVKPVTVLDALLQENGELIAIFVASLKTTAKGRG
jgi:four helix bundle protein